MPELTFKLDTSIAEGARILDLIQQVEEKEKAQQQSSKSDRTYDE
jgi:hypothetical protein